MKIHKGSTLRLSRTRDGCIKITPIWNKRTTIQKPPRITKPKTQA